MSAQAQRTMIDVQDFLRTHSVEEINRAAEEFFAKITDWTYVLAKPFAAPEDCAKLLIEFWAVLEGLEVSSMMDVMEFGAGSCWAAHFLSQMGCKVYACDVSATALEMGKKRYRDHPTFGNQPPPEFVVYDGFRFPLPDKSMDRILCMHALHHVPNVSHVLREMSRILREEGVAAFTEPGPKHSTNPVSQRELEHGVLENDIVIENIWEWARAAGFKRLEMTVFPIERVAMSLEDYGRFVDGDTQLSQKVLTPIRNHAAVTRTFFLYKEAKPVLRSSSTRGLAGELGVLLTDKKLVFTSGSQISFEIYVRNTGQAIWLPSGVRAGSVNVGYHLKNLKTGEYFNDYGGRALLGSDPIEPGRMVRVEASIPAPEPGSYELTFDLVSEWVCWFADRGLAKAASFGIEVR